MKRILTPLSCLTRLAMTLVLMLSAMGAGAQTDYFVTFEPNYAGWYEAEAQAEIIRVKYDWTSDKYKYSINLAYLESRFKRGDAHHIIGWALTAYGVQRYVSDATLELEGDLTLYAIWDDGSNPYIGTEFTVDGMKYAITSIHPLEVALKEGIDDPYVTIPASVTYEGVNFAVTSIENGAFRDYYFLTSVDIPASVASIGVYAFIGCNNLKTAMLHSNPILEDWIFPGGVTVTMTLPANPADGAYWTTFFNYLCTFQADKNTTVYKATVDKENMQLKLHEVKDKIVKSGTAVILKSSGNPVMTSTTSASANTDGNDLLGRIMRSSCSDIRHQYSLPESSTFYVMGKIGDNFGFFEYKGDYMPANKAYILFAEPEPSSGAPTRGLSFVEEEVTTICDVTTDKGYGSASKAREYSQQTTDCWYTLSGVKLTGKPTTKGVYLHNGRKEVVQ